VSVTYAPDGTLDLVFHRGARYRYFAVPPRLVEALLAADYLPMRVITHVNGSTGATGVSPA
jgi:hypothetical protein